MLDITTFEMLLPKVILKLQD